MTGRPGRRKAPGGGLKDGDTKLGMSPAFCSEDADESDEAVVERLEAVVPTDCEYSLSSSTTSTTFSSSCVSS